MTQLDQDSQEAGHARFIIAACDNQRRAFRILSRRKFDECRMIITAIDREYRRASIGFRFFIFAAASASAYKLARHKSVRAQHCCEASDTLCERWLSVCAGSVGLSRRRLMKSANVAHYSHARVTPGWETRRQA